MLLRHNVITDHLQGANNVITDHLEVPKGGKMEGKKRKSSLCKAGVTKDPQKIARNLAQDLSGTGNCSANQ
jgi:hypothetical protein